jgi:hypothetical protein
MLIPAVVVGVMSKDRTANQELESGAGADNATAAWLR